MDGIINNPNNQAPPFVPVDKRAAKPAPAAPVAKKQDKFTDVLSQVADYDIQNPTLKVTDKPSPV